MNATRLLVLLSLILAAVSATTAWWMETGKYTATFQFRVTPTPATLFDDHIHDRDDFPIFKNTQQQYIKSDFVLHAALRHEAVSHLPVFQRQSDPVRWLAENIRVEFPGDGEVMNISLTADSAKEAAVLVAAVSKAYLDEVVNQEREQQHRRYADLQAASEKHKKNAKEKRADLRRIAEALEGDKPELLLDRRMILEQWTAARRELTLAQNAVERLEAELELKNAEFDRATNSGDTVVPQLDLEMALSADLEMQKLVARRRAINAPIELWPDDERLKDLEKQPAELEKVEKEIAERRAEIEQVLQRQKLAFMKNEIEQLKTELAAHRELVKKFAEDEAELRQQLKSQGGSSLEIERLRREIQALEDVVRPMENQGQELQIELERPPRVQRLTRVEGDSPEKMVSNTELTLDQLTAAIMPHEPDQDSRVKKAILAGCKGALALIILRFVWLLFTFSIPPRWQQRPPTDA